MNPDQPQIPFAGAPEGSEREARITAKLLGELTPEEVAALDAEIARDPELARTEARLRHTLDCVRLAAAEPMEPVGGGSPLPRFSPGRREKLLEQLRTPRRREEASAATVIPVDFPSMETGGSGAGRSSWLVLAACLVALLTLAAMWVGSIDAVRARSRGDDFVLARGAMPAQALGEIEAAPAMATAPVNRGMAMTSSYSMHRPGAGAVWFKGAANAGPLRETKRDGSEDTPALLNMATAAPSAPPTEPGVDRLGVQALAPAASLDQIAESEATAATAPEAPARFQMQPQLMQRYGLMPNARPGLAGGGGTPETALSLVAADDAKERLEFRLTQVPASGTLSGTPGGTAMVADGAKKEAKLDVPALLSTAPANGPVAAVAGGLPADFVGGRGGAAKPEADSAGAVAAGVVLSRKQVALVDATDDSRKSGEIEPESLNRRGMLTAWDVADPPTPAEVSARRVLVEQLSEVRQKAKAASDKDAFGRSSEASVAESVLGDVPVLGKALTADGVSAGSQEEKENRGLLENGRVALSYFQAPTTVESFEFRVAASGGTETVAAQIEDVGVRVVTNAVAAPSPLVPQPEVQAAEDAFSTFSLNVSDVSFKLASATLESGQLPTAGSVRVEEFVNAFQYRDPEPAAGRPIRFVWERAQYPFAQQRDILRLSVKTGATGRQSGRPLNVVLLLDGSGSMERSDRVATIRELLKVLARQLQPADRVSVVTFARSARLWIDGMPGSQAGELVDRVGQWTPEGGTHLEEALNVGYDTARKHFMPDGMNRVVLLTDGAANLGELRSEVLRATVEANRKRGIALDCFGVGFDGYQDDLLEALSRNGDGRYGFVNSPEEAATGFVNQLAGALNVAASDVKVQVEFHPERVKAWRQVGYARHQLTREQFRDNAVDAAEIGAAESGNALYVIEPHLRGRGPIATVRVRFRDPVANTYSEHAWDVPFDGGSLPLEQASPALRLATVAAALGEMLSMSPYAAEVRSDRLLSLLQGVPDAFQPDPRPDQLVRMVQQTQAILGR